MPRQAIVTKYLGPSNTRGSRIKATVYVGSVTIAWNHALDAWGNHEQAAFALAFKMQWLGSEPTTEQFREQYAQGGLPGSGYAFVQRGVK